MKTERDKFEDYLMEKHSEQFIGTKDMLVDDFENWLVELMVDEWIDLCVGFNSKEV